jgi:hypothetical protein
MSYQSEKYKYSSPIKPLKDKKGVDPQGCTEDCKKYNHCSIRVGNVRYGMDLSCKETILNKKVGKK